MNFVVKSEKNYKIKTLIVMSIFIFNVSLSVSAENPVYAKTNNGKEITTNDIEKQMKAEQQQRSITNLKRAFATIVIGGITYIVIQNASQSGMFSQIITAADAAGISSEDQENFQNIASQVLQTVTSTAVVAQVAGEEIKNLIGTGYKNFMEKIGLEYTPSEFNSLIKKRNELTALYKLMSDTGLLTDEQAKIVKKKVSQLKFLDDAHFSKNGDLSHPQQHANELEMMLSIARLNRHVTFNSQEQIDELKTKLNETFATYDEALKDGIWEVLMKPMFAQGDRKILHFKGKPGVGKTVVATNAGTIANVLTVLVSTSNLEAGELSRACLGSGNANSNQGMGMMAMMGGAKSSSQGNPEMTSALTNAINNAPVDQLHSGVFFVMDEIDRAIKEGKISESDVLNLGNYGSKQLYITIGDTQFPVDSSNASFIFISNGELFPLDEDATTHAKDQVDAINRRTAKYVIDRVDIGKVGDIAKVNLASRLGVDVEVALTEHQNFLTQIEDWQTEHIESYPGVAKMIEIIDSYVAEFNNKFNLDRHVIGVKKTSIRELTNDQFKILVSRSTGNDLSK
ncbi:hypothetical protein OAB57_02550 [Bacteriovoracaceae bacterium]|nr:hypothetical protein [Bacteriovoracaceae bacterium]